MTAEFYLLDLSGDKLLESCLAAERTAAKKLISFAARFNLHGDIFKAYLSYLLIREENPYALQCERGKVPHRSLEETALKDAEKLFSLFNDPSVCARLLPELANWKGESQTDKYYAEAGEVIASFSKKLSAAKDPESFLRACRQHYLSHGAGECALDHAFRLKEDSSDIEPIILGEMKRMSDLVGLEMQKEALMGNTRAFVEGKGGVNVLLYGDGGTGKTTSVKALLSEFSGKRLKMIEIYKHQFKYLNALISRIKHRGYKYILFLDDLSFEDSEVEYKYLKTIIEGGLEPRPDNVLIYATSNRRHLIRESWKDREESDDMHAGDTVEEKLSLVKRFGLTLYYPSPDQKEYLNIVRTLAEREGIKPSDALEQAALVWQRREGGMSGRTAEQFLIGEKQKR